MYLLENTEVYIDQRNGDNGVALHYVAKRGILKLVRLFIEAYGADWTLQDEVSYHSITMILDSILTILYRKSVLHFTMRHCIVNAMQTTWMLFATWSI